MFTGIVQEKARLISATSSGDVVTWKVSFSEGFLKGVQLGASIALNGCCLTVTGVQGTQVSFDLVPETVARTGWSAMREGALLNAERSLCFGDEVGGHLVSGHVDGIATIAAIESFEPSKVITFQVPPALIQFIFEKGYIALNGASLTVTEVDPSKAAFKVSLIPETLQRTTFGALRVGDTVNVEVDRATQAVVITVERFLQRNK